MSTILRGGSSATAAGLLLAQVLLLLTPSPVDANPLAGDDYSSEKKDLKKMIDELVGHAADAPEGQQEADLVDTLAAEEELLVSSNRDHRRNLEVLYSTEDSTVCRQCIEDNNVMCVNTEHDRGTCCSTKDACEELDVCSYMVPRDSFGLKHWSCPHNLSVCGNTPYLVASKDVI